MDVIVFINKCRYDLKNKTRPTKLLLYSNIIDIHYITSGQNFIGCSSISAHKVGNNTFQSCSL
jgi:hypothetical protein